VAHDALGARRGNDAAEKVDDRIASAYRVAAAKLELAILAEAWASSSSRSASPDQL
jgi:hypothetical protein